MPSWVRRAKKTISPTPLAVLLVGLSLACVKEPAKVEAPEGASPAEGAFEPSEVPVTFAFDSLDERPVSSDAARGRPAVLVFIQTGSVWAQAQVNFVLSLSRAAGDAVAYYLVALEPRDSRELVETYARVLGVTFPTALADESTMLGAGPFGMLKVPAVAVLDRAGRNSVARRRTGGADRGNPQPSERALRSCSGCELGARS